MAEFDYIETFVKLDWYVKEQHTRSQKYAFTGNRLIIRTAHEAATQGSKLLASVEDGIAPLIKLGFECTPEAVPTSVNGTWFNMYFLSFGTESKNLQKIEATDFIVVKLKEMGYSAPELRFKLFYLPSLPAATTTEGHHMITVNGFANILKERVEINIFPPRDYPSIFKNLVHEAIHICLLEKNKGEKPADVEAKVEKDTAIFFQKFGKEWASIEKTALNELQKVIDGELPLFFKAETHLHVTVDISKAKFVIAHICALFDAVLQGNVTVQ